MLELEGDNHRPDPLMAAPVIRALTAARSALGLGSAEPLSLVVAVSGGEDSVVLLDLLDRISRSEDSSLRLIVAHFNHRLRPESSDEAAFVARLADRLGLQCKIGDPGAEQPSGNLEAWAREVRYRFLEQVRAEAGADLIATAHHRLDQTETFLFRVISGRLASGTTGIRSVDTVRRVIRPVLEIEKTSVEEYALKNGLSFVFDSSNSDLSRTRNRIRHQIIPLLSRMNPNLTGSITTAAGRLADDEKYLEHAAEAALIQTAGEPTIGWLAGLPPVLGWRVLRILARQQIGASAHEIGYDGFNRVIHSLVRGGPRHSTVELGRGISCRIDRRGWITFFHWAGESAAGESNLEAVNEPAIDPVDTGGGDEPVEQNALRHLPVPGDLLLQLEDRSRVKITSRIINVHEIDVSMALARLKEEPGNYIDQAVALFDYSVVVKSELAVRPRLPGDRIVLWGRGTRKVKKVFQEHQVMLTLRDCLPIVCSNGIVLWIPGVARSQFAPVTENTTLILQLIYSRMLSI